MGLSLTAYGLLALSGGGLLYTRKQHKRRPLWLRPVHYTIGGIMVFLVLLLLSIGIVGTLGEYGSLGHSVHLPAGLGVVALTLASGWSATQIGPDKPWARRVHLTINSILFVGFVLVTATGWSVVQKYL